MVAAAGIGEHPLWPHVRVEINKLIEQKSPSVARRRAREGWAPVKCSTSEVTDVR